MQKKSDLEKLQFKVGELERMLKWNREGDIRCWKALMTICKHLNIKLDEEVVGIDVGGKNE